MTPERWRQMEQLFADARQLPVAERATYLEETCAGDDTMRRAVEDLLAADDKASGFLSRPALELEAEGLATEIDTAPMPMHVGKSFGHYNILSRIGAGGMGEVWLAQDSKLERRVAIKVLPTQFTQDESRLQRFVREAKAASALNHPNIITIHEIGEAFAPAGKIHFIATEFIEGETLRARMSDRTPGEEITLREALNLTIQAASALDAAHQSGIVHRDIKPENIMVRPDGLVKVLDFGLAKLTPRQLPQSNDVDTNAPTQSEQMQTLPGMILGTLRYMSPEQARGRDVDARTDIFSLGVVLYELITRRPPFAGETSADVIAAIIHTEPAPPSDFVPDVPAELERIMRKALAKNVRDRYQTARDLQLDLQTLKEEFDLSAQMARLRLSGSNRLSGFTRPAAPSFRRGGVMALIFIALIAFAGIARKLVWQPPGQPPRELSFETLFGRKGQDNALLLDSRFSPNGKLLTFGMTGESGSNIWVRQIGSDGEQQITFGEWEDGNPVWSPDGDNIAFISTRGNQLGIWATSALGGTPTLIKTLGDSQTLANRGRLRMVAWANSSPVVYYEWEYNLFRLDLSTKEARPLIPPKQPFQLPQDFALSPDERETVFTARQNGQYDLWRIALGGAAPRRVTNDAAVDQHPLWLSDDRLLYNSTRIDKMQLYAVEPSGGEPSLISTGDHQCQLADFSDVTKRILCYEQRDDSDILAIGAESGAERELTDDYGIELWSNLSPDGQTLLYQAIPGDRFVWDIRKGSLLTKPVTTKGKATRLVPDAFDAQWSPDGEQVAFLRLVEQTVQLWTVKAVGSELKSLVTENLFFGGWRSSPPYNRSEARSWDWSPDGSRIAYSSKQNGVANIWIKPINGSQPTKASNNNDDKLSVKCPIWSPDGQRLAYVIETDGQSAAGKQVWSVWVASQGQSKMIFQTEKRLRLRGWLENNRLLAALAENVAGSGSQPTTVELISLAISAGTEARGDQHSIGSLTETYLSNLHLAPGGGRIAFVKAQNRRHDIWVAAVNGDRMSQPRKVTNNSDPAFRFASLTWSPDGKIIFYDKQTRWSLLTTSALSN